ncbi:hypothetical protein F5148DRAFT_759662 [Russula earlei]|uniref:Uncharacterized protein n=1 Tax=Russula earlei TaxID=71964 RepID=A0ACC0UCU2_9AGAM|nr:hypothetical protein F5148DRAFT_759662 [Russula earlei]
MDTLNVSYPPPSSDSGESSSSNSSSHSSNATSPDSSLLSTPASSVFDLPKLSRNPHELPVFGTETLTNPGQPILYLPPILSSLPHTYGESKITASTAGRLPKATEAHLPYIDAASLSLHKALHNFTPVTEKYASTSYAEAFNWDELDLPEDDEHDWYCVAFRSLRKPDSESGGTSTLLKENLMTRPNHPSALYEADRAAHEEAVQNGGLLMYWYGIPDPETGLNLATCIWQSRAHAVAANSRPHHVQAMRLAAASYHSYELERWTLRKTAGSIRLEVLPYDRSTAGQ